MFTLKVSGTSVLRPYHKKKEKKRTHHIGNYHKLMFSFTRP